MNFFDMIHTLQLNDDLIPDNQIHAKMTIQYNSLVHHRYFDLPLIRNFTQPHFFT